jgi:hypothetical protein
VFERVIATTGAKATENQDQNKQQNFSAYLRISSSISIGRKVISDRILLITAYKQNTEEERNKAAMKTLSLSLSLSLRVYSLSLRDQTCEGISTAAAEEIFFKRFWEFSSRDFGKKIIGNFCDRNSWLIFVNDIFFLKLNFNLI